MKKLFIGVAFAGSLFINAQEKTKSSSPITFGVKGGLNLSTVSEDSNYSEYHDDENKMKAGFHAGVFVNIPVAQKFSIQPELLFSQLGAKIEERERFLVGDYSYRREADYKANFNYLVLPVMVQYNILPQLYVEAGPEFGYLLGGRFKGDDVTTIRKSVNSPTVTTRESLSEKLDTDLYNRFQFGIGIGAGYYFTQNFGVTARFTAGITNIMDNGDSDYKIRNNALQVGVAYKFK
ncbi:porin family protein [Chryseobacterium jejuense]|uniref:Outer membrane protein beta-barrel domain-containing protein n=1 Tax=Chryseobacterium jejuense TaxID=445960 RepID=A0A2X2XL12_CHRJE|nr:porin family protein [Chryseobacterium jejuense]SDI98796.1 Outer membrane protein beta-barrel domain-containing protein [Chryseobacterium jejuense]SQB27050.1 Uncharacterised protein [Chryseobacterium jejuense]